MHHCFLYVMQAMPGLAASLVQKVVHPAELQAPAYVGNTTLASLQLASNIRVVDWAPQNDVLGHAALKAFVTQAGTNSLYEAAYHGKPIVAIPLIAEQPDNAIKVNHTLHHSLSHILQHFLHHVLP